MSDQSKSLYVEISEKILHSIRSGEYSENTSLPTEQALCEKYHVSRNTIRLAVRRLKEMEVVYTVQGTGAFIKPQVFEQPLMKFYSFTDTLKSSNVLIQNGIVSYEEVLADSKLAKKTGYPQETPFHKLCRLRSAQEYPLMLETTYLPKSRFVMLDLDVLSKGSLYEFLRTKYNFHVDKALETIQPVMPRTEEKNLLQVSANIPCMLLERFSYEGALLVEYTKSIVRGDKYIFQAHLQNFPV